MNKNSDKNQAFKILEKVEEELREIQLLVADYRVKEKISKLIEFIEEETINDRDILKELIYTKVKETKGSNPEFNTYFYLLYRKLTEGQISMQEAQVLYDMYEKELRAM